MSRGEGASICSRSRRGDYPHGDLLLLRHPQREESCEPGVERPVVRRQLRESVRVEAVLFSFILVNFYNTSVPLYRNVQYLVHVFRIHHVCTVTFEWYGCAEH